MRRRKGPYRVAEGQPHTVDFDEDTILHRVAIDREAPAQKSSKDANQKNNTEYRSLTKRATSPNNISTDDERGDNSKMV